MMVLLSLLLLCLLLLLPPLSVHLRGDLLFRCPGCTAELLSLCAQLSDCEELVREPGCGCCPVCARGLGESCGVYTPRCALGLVCTPSPHALYPLQDLLLGQGRCSPRADPPEETNDVPTEVPAHRPPLDPRWQEAALKQHQRETKTRMKSCSQEDRRAPKVPLVSRPQSACQAELDKVMEDVSKISSEDLRGPLENLSQLKFPNCDRFGLYNIKQCNMSLRGQRGECWCVDPVTGAQVQDSPQVRGDPNCEQYLTSAAAAAAAAAAASQHLNSTSLQKTWNTEEFY